MVINKKQIKLKLYQATLIMFIISSFGFYRIKNFQPVDKNLDIAIIQPNIDPNEKWDYKLRKETMAIMDSLYQNAIDMNPDLFFLKQPYLHI